MDSEDKRGLFITGTDTGVGKTVLAAAICAALDELDFRVAAFKPAVTGIDDPPGEWPQDHELLARAAGGHQTGAEVAPYRFGPAVSPHYAAELANQTIEPRKLRAWARGSAEDADILVTEGVGGFMVPLTYNYLVRDLAVDLGYPVLVAARPGLGTLNHTRLTVDAVRAAELDVAGVVLTPWPDQPDPLAASNRRTLERIVGARIFGLEPTSPDRLAAAGSRLPIHEWLAHR